MEIQITAIKFEMVNGKKTGKSFTFKMDPKKMAEYKTEATLRKKIDEYVAKSGVFKKEELKDLKYSMKDFLEEWKKQIPIVEAEELAKNAKYDLDRFLAAQEADYYEALDEIRAGRKTGHWIWYIFPQQKGLGPHSRKDLVIATILSIMVLTALMRLEPIWLILFSGLGSGKSLKHCSSMKENEILTLSWAVILMC